MATLTIMDPVTRIEGHMKVEVNIDNGTIVDAHCTGTLFRGFENLLQGREPWDAPVLTQRICGVCPISHAQASVLALDNAAGAAIPPAARTIRNLTLGSNFIQSHILHFYLLAALDYLVAPAVPPFTPTWEVDKRDGAAPILNNLLGPAMTARRRAHEMGAVFREASPAPPPATESARCGSTSTGSWILSTQSTSRTSNFWPRCMMIISTSAPAAET